MIRPFAIRASDPHIRHNPARCPEESVWVSRCCVMPTPDPLKAIWVGNQCLVHNGAEVRTCGLVPVGLHGSRSCGHRKNFIRQHFNERFREALFILDALLDPAIA